MTTSTYGIIASLLSSVTWAIGSARYSKIAETTNPLFINFTRALISLPAFLILLIISVKGNGSDFINLFLNCSKETYFYFFISVIASYAFGDLLFFYSSRFIGVTSALAIASSYPLLTVLIEFTNGQTLKPIQWMGLCTTLFGVVMVILLGKKSAEGDEKFVSENLNSKKRFFLGVFLGLLTAVAWTINTISVSKGGKDIHAALGNSIRMIFALITISIFSWMQLKTKPKLVHPTDLKKYGWVFLVEAFGGSFFYVYGMSHTPLYIASTLSSLAPVIAVPLAVAMKLERFSVRKLIAICLVVFGIYLLNK